MKSTYSELAARIETTSNGKGRSRYYTATCPICLVSYDVDVLSSDASARVMTVQRVVSHIRSAHSEEVADETTRGKNG